jgi:glycosyltransferase involved in cell wall biosynthesis
MQENKIGPKISIIIPVYNTEKYLGKCLESATSQTYTNLEIIIIDDGSTDRSPAIMDDLKKKNKKITVLRKKNEGLSKTRNLGISLSTGYYILHLDSDDWIEPDMCSVLGEAARVTNADIITTNIFKEEVGKTTIKRECFKKNCMQPEEYLHDFSLYPCLNSCWNKLIKRNLYMDNNIKHYEDISLGEDCSALLRVIVHAKKILYIDKAFYHYNLKSNGMSRNINKPIWQYMIGLERVREYYIKAGKEIIDQYYPFLKLRIVYTLLFHCSYLKAKKYNYVDYVKLWHAFSVDIIYIIKGEKFRYLSLKYKLFVLFYFVFFGLYKKLI